MSRQSKDLGTSPQILRVVEFAKTKFRIIYQKLMLSKIVF